MKEEVIKTEIFADPTYDITFKMLFGNDKNKDVLISFLNNILGFKGEKEILDVEINSNELLGDSDKSVQSSVDILCTNKGKQKIAIEMQRIYEDYFLAREQEYMSKIISQQVTSGQSSKYHEVMLDTYVIVIAKNNIFPDRLIKDPNKMKKFQGVYDNDKINSTKEIYYYKEVVPMIKGYNIEIPDNKMNWVFCELSKFKKQHKDDVIDGTFSIKEQWLDFLINANTREKAVENLNEIVKKGYEIMKSVLLSEDTRTLYWKEKRDKELHEKAKAEQEKEISDKAFFEGVEKGKLKGEIKGEISKIKNFIELEVPQEKFISKLHYLNEEKFKNDLDFNLSYIKDHLEETESAIGEHLNLFDKMDIEHSS